jgi:N-acyl homoserine lactone hydrolase
LYLRRRRGFFAAASVDRLKKVAANLKATVIIQHAARDIDKLPTFPASAK